MNNENVFDREPIFWTTTKPGYNDRDRQRLRVEKGRRIVEKFPQTGHAGDYDNPVKARGVRFIYVVTNHGNEIPLVLTNGASHLDPNSGYGQYVKRKARFLGWIPTGACPVMLLISGELRPHHIVEQSLLHADPCGNDARRDRFHMCPHLEAEKKARLEQHKQDEAERLASYKDQGEKILEAQREQTAALVEALAKATADRQSPESIAAMIEAFREVMRSERKGKSKDE